MRTINTLIATILSLQLALSPVVPALTSDALAAEPAAKAEEKAPANKKISATIVKIDGGGSAMVRRKNGMQSVAGEKQEIFPGDKITTDGKATVEMMLPDGTIVRIGLNSEYKVDSAEPKQGFIAWVFELTKGSVRALVEKSPDKKNVKFRVNTPTGTMGVRGTELVLAYKPGSGSTELFTIEGRVEFGAPNCFKTKTCREVSAGERSSIGKGESEPLPPVKFNPLELIDAAKEHHAKESEKGSDMTGPGTVAGADPAKDVKDLTKILEKVDAAKMEEVKERLALFTTLKKAEGSSVNSLGEVTTMVEKSSAEMAEAQNTLLKRSEETKKAMYESMNDGSYWYNLALADAYDNKVKGRQVPTAFRAQESYSGETSAKKFNVSRALLATGKFPTAKQFYEKRASYGLGSSMAKGGAGGAGAIGTGSSRMTGASAASAISSVQAELEAATSQMMAASAKLANTQKEFDRRIEEAKDQKDAAEAAAKLLETELDKKTTRISYLEGETIRIQGLLDLKSDDLDRVNSELGAMETERDNLLEELSRLQKELDGDGSGDVGLRAKYDTLSKQVNGPSGYLAQIDALTKKINGPSGLQAQVDALTIQINGDGTPGNPGLTAQLNAVKLEKKFLQDKYIAVKEALAKAMMYIDGQNKFINGEIDATALLNLKNGAKYSVIAAVERSTVSDGKTIKDELSSAIGSAALTESFKSGAQNPFHNNFDSLKKLNDKITAMMSTANITYDAATEYKAMEEKLIKLNDTIVALKKTPPPAPAPAAAPTGALADNQELFMREVIPDPSRMINATAIRTEILSVPDALNKLLGSFSSADLKSLDQGSNAVNPGVWNGTALANAYITYTLVDEDRPDPSGGPTRSVATRTTQSDGSVKCFKVGKVCTKQYTGCNLTSGKFCSPEKMTFTTNCKDTQVEVSCSQP